MGIVVVEDLVTLLRVDLADVVRHQRERCVPNADEDEAV